MTDEKPAAAAAITADETRQNILFVLEQRATDTGKELDRIERLARAAAACRALTEAMKSDDELTNMVDSRSLQLAQNMAETPAAHTGHIALKLAALVMEMQRDYTDASQLDRLRLNLATSCLADCVTLAAGPVAVPPGAELGANGGDLATAQAWRSQADAVRAAWGPK